MEFKIYTVMLGWHRTYGGQSNLMAICERLHHLADQWNSALDRGAFADADKDPKTFQEFYMTVAQFAKIANKLSAALLHINSAIYLEFQKHEKGFHTELVLLRADEQTNHHILNQLKILKKHISEMQQQKKYNPAKMEQVYLGLSRLDTFFNKSIEEVDKMHHILKKEMDEAKELAAHIGLKKRT